MNESAYLITIDGWL